MPALFAVLPDCRAQIGQQIISIFQTDAATDQPRRDSQFQLGRGIQPLMRCRRRMGDDLFCITQIVGNREYFQPVEQ